MTKFIVLGEAMKEIKKTENRPSQCDASAKAPDAIESFKQGLEKELEKILEQDLKSLEKRLSNQDFS